MSMDTGTQGALLERATLPELHAHSVSVPGVEKPVAQILLDSPLPYLDRTFDYLVPTELDKAAKVGTRCTIRFGGQEMRGWIWNRTDSTAHLGKLLPIRKVVSDLPVLTAQTMSLVEHVAERFCGNRADVIRLAVPTRHASTEKSEREKPVPDFPNWKWGVEQQTDSYWNSYPGGEQWCRALSHGEAPRAVWNVLPESNHDCPPYAPHWSVLVAQAAQATLAGGRGVLLLTATAKQAEQAAQKLQELLPGEPIVTLTAEQGAASRYRSFTKLLLGHARVAVGTRAAAYAPVPNLGLAVVWDDGDDRLDERRAPYAHARQVLTLRSAFEKAGLLVAGYHRTVEAQALVDSGWAQSLVAPRYDIRGAVAQVSVPGEEDLEAEGASGHARIPSLAHREVRQALERGPVLVQVARSGYAPMVACARCRTASHCPHCNGPLAMEQNGNTSCRWCARPIAQASCSQCGSTELRMVSIGSVRTAEELGRAFSNVPVVVSGARSAHGVVEQVDNHPRLVVATPGAEPYTAQGYRLVLLLDGAALSSRPELGASAEALRLWSNAAALASSDGKVLLLGSPEAVSAQALVRWDHEGYARRELAERLELHLPPAWRAARIDGPHSEVSAYLSHAQHVGFETLGPVPVTSLKEHTQTSEPNYRGLVRAPIQRGKELAQVLRQFVLARGVLRAPAVRIELDPTVLW